MSLFRYPSGFSTVLQAIVATLFLSPVSVAQDDEPADATAEERTPLLTDPSLWVLDFNVVKVRSITLFDGPRKGVVFWYMIYTIENKTGEDRRAYIAVTATSDKKKTYSDVVMPDVERAIERKFGQPLWGKADVRKAQEKEERDTKDPYYNYETFASGKKRTCVAVLHRLDPRANKIRITVRGLSNDLKLIQNDDGTRTIEERVYALDYERPKDQYKINLDRFIPKRKGWSKIRTDLVIPGESTDGDGESADGDSTDEETEDEADQEG